MSIYLVNIPEPVLYEIYTVAFPFDLRCESVIYNGWDKVDGSPYHLYKFILLNVWPNHIILIHTSYFVPLKSPYNFSWSCHFLYQSYSDGVKGDLQCCL